MALNFPSNPVDGQVYNNYSWSASTNAWRSLNSIYAPNALKNATFNTASASGVPVTIQGYSSQSANLQEWKNSSGTTLASVDSLGNLSNPAINTTNLYLNRQDASYEGGQINLRRSIDNSDYWYIDVYGNTSTPSLRMLANTQINMQIDASGRVNMPYQPAFFAYRTDGIWAAQTWIANNTYLNVGGHYNTSTGRFTAPVAGRYFFGINAIGHTSGTTRIYPRINGNSQFGGFHLRSINTANYGDAHMTWIYNLAAGDYVDIYLGEGYNYSDGTPYAYWHGFLLH